jgi:hypothetical protein
MLSKGFRPAKVLEILAAPRQNSGRSLETPQTRDAVSQAQVQKEFTILLPQRHETKDPTSPTNITIMAGYSFDNPYNTGYGAQGGGDGGGFMQGEVTSSPAGGKVGSPDGDSRVPHILTLT